MREQLPIIKRIFIMSADIDDAIESAYRSGRVDGVLQYIQEQLKKMEEKGKDDTRKS